MGPLKPLSVCHGGISYICDVLECHAHTIREGIKELDSFEAMNNERIRQPGGGRKRAIDIIEDLEPAFLRIINRHTAGSPTGESIKWTHLTRQQIADLLLEEEKIDVSVTVVDQLLNKHNFRRRKAFKTKATGEHPKRNEQFENINKLVENYKSEGNPVISMDTKKKEFLGQLYREGHTWTEGTIKVDDHDWPSLAKGKIIPHGLYDITYNFGYIQIGTSHETSEFACDSIRYW